MWARAGGSRGRDAHHTAPKQGGWAQERGRKGTSYAVSGTDICMSGTGVGERAIPCPILAQSTSYAMSGTDIGRLLRHVRYCHSERAMGTTRFIRHVRYSCPVLTQDILLPGGKSA
eukprot:286859-Rhodomonas_salina.1